MSENKQVPIKFTAAHLEYVRQYGGSCRDCADECGICPGSGLPCANSAKSIKHVLDALEYGINHGYAPPIEAAVLSASAGEKKIIDPGRESTIDKPDYGDFVRGWNACRDRVLLMQSASKSNQEQSTNKEGE